MKIADTQCQLNSSPSYVLIKIHVLQTLNSVFNFEGIDTVLTACCAGKQRYGLSTVVLIK